jgi:hypothetical protein
MVHSAGCEGISEFSFRPPRLNSHVETHMIYKLGCSQSFYTFALMLLKKIILFSKFRRTKFIKCFEMKSPESPLPDP